MATGALACKVSLVDGETLALEELRLKIREHTAVPPGEQFLFPAAGGPELRDAGAVIAGGSGCSSDGDSASIATRSHGGEVASSRRDSVNAATTLLMVRSLRDPRITDLSHFHGKVNLEVPPVGGFTALRRLGRGPRGEMWLYRLGPNLGTLGGGSSRGQFAFARLLRAGALEKRGGETSEHALYMQHASESRLAWQQEDRHGDTLTEIGVLTYLARQGDLPLYLLRMVGTFCMDQENWLVTEFADGGKLLEAVALNRDAMASKKKRRYMWQLLHALKYLHQHHIGHRDVSLDNVLLKDGNIRLANFSASVRSHTESGEVFRYYRAVGRDPYCAPECQQPSSPRASVEAPAGARAGDIVLVRVQDTYLCEVRLPEGAQPGVQCSAELWGYAANSADIFAAGVCLYIMGMQTPPWRTARLSDPCFSHLYRKGGAELFDTLLDWIPDGRLEHDDVELLSRMLRLRPGDRPCAGDCLESPWFADMAHAPVCTHGQSSVRAAAAGGC